LIEELAYEIDVWFLHRISIPAYAVEQQWWQLGVTKNEMSLMSFIFKMMLVLYQSVSISGSISNIYWHVSKWSSISFSHWQYPSDREFSFPLFVGLLILSLWYKSYIRQIVYACKYRTSIKFNYRLTLFSYHDVKLTVTLMTEMALSKKSTRIDYYALGSFINKQYFYFLKSIILGNCS
jgi:hypothetical protein